MFCVSVVTFIVAFLALVSLGLSALTLLGLSRALRGPKRQRAARTKGREPSVLVIMPCKGIDLNFDDTIEAAKHQSYGNYEIIGVIDSDDDPSHEILERHGVRVMITDRRRMPERCSGKSFAILTALRNLGREYDVFVVLDSDTTVGRDWLRLLVRPLLSDDSIGVSTTFPTFSPVSGFWSRVKLVWGLVGRSMQNSSRTMFPWGGSMAFKRTLLDRVVAELARNASDDIAVGRASRSMGLGVVSVPRAMPTVFVKESFGTFYEWSVRQTAWALQGNGALFKYGVTYYSAFCLNDVLLAYYAAALSPMAAIFAAPLLLNIAGFCAQTRRYSPAYYPIVALMPVLYLADLLAGKTARRVRWRGATYRLY